MIEEMTKEEIDLIMREVISDEICGIEEIKNTLGNVKTFFNIKYKGSNRFTFNSNRALESYMFDDLQHFGFTIRNVWPRENNEGPLLTIEVSYVKPKGKGS